MADDLSDLIVDAVTTDDGPWWPLLSLLELVDHEVEKLPPRRRRLRQAALDRIREDFLFDGASWPTPSPTPSSAVAPP